MKQKTKNIPEGIEISIIVISYNTRDLTLACLNSIYDQTKSVSFEVICLDNNSFDNSAQYIMEQFPDVMLIKSTYNCGFAKANNIAVKKSRGRYVLLLNPDTVVLENSIEKLLRFAKDNPKARIWGGKTLNADRTLNPTSSWRFMTLSSLFFQATGLSVIFRQNAFFDREAYGGWQRDTVRHVEIVSGCFLLIDKEMWDELEGFDEEFFMYAEEADLCYRACKIGARPLFSPTPSIIHYGGASESVRSEKLIRLFKAKNIFIKKHWSKLEYFIARQLFKAHALNRYAGFYIAAKLLRNEKYEIASRQWYLVWKFRKEWI